MDERILDCYDDRITDSFLNNYWEKWEIKRKYKNQPAVFIWKFQRRKSPFELLPKEKWTHKRFRIR